MNFKIGFKELAFFKAQLKKDQNLSRAVPDITSSILKFNALTERSVNSKFNVPSGMSLSDVLIGKNVSSDNIGNTLLRFSLQYRHKNIPLYKFPHKLKPSSSLSSAPVRMGGNPLGFVKWTIGEWSSEVETFVLKSTGFINHTPQPIFANDWRGKQLLRYREGEATWSTFPSKGTKGVRAPTLPGWGMSLSQMANYALATDDNLKKAKYNVGTEIINSLVKSL